MSVRPGLTSLATLYLPKDVERRRKFRYDLLYIQEALLLAGRSSHRTVLVGQRLRSLGNPTEQDLIRGPA